MLNSLGPARGQEEASHAVMSRQRLWGGTTSEWVILMPSLLMVFGPPVWRAYGSRGLGASAAGRVDVFVLLQLLVYGLAAAVVVMHVLKWRDQRLMPRQIAPWVLGLLSIPTLMWMSAINAPSAFLTTVMSSLFAIGLGSAIFVGLCIGTDKLRLEFVLTAFFKVNLILILLVLVANIVSPETVNVYSQGRWRVKGNDIGNMSLAGAVTFVYAAYHFMRTGRVLWSGVLVFFAAIALSLPDVRIGYAAAALGVGAMLLFSLRMRGGVAEPQVAGYRTNLLGPAAVLLPVLGVLIAAFFYDDIYSALTRDKPEALSTLSGRTLIWDWISDNAEVFVGHGFVAGFRHDFQGMSIGEYRGLMLESLNPSKIGSAHSAFFELVYGLGWLGAIWVAGIVMATLFTRLSTLKLSDRFDHLMVRVIAMVMVTYCLTQSTFLLPPSHEFGCLMYAIAIALGVRWRQWNRVR